VSASELTQPAFTTNVKAILAETGADPTRLILEITESEMLDHSDSPAAALHRLRQIGARVAIDDFGSGYASINHLRRLPVDLLKLDQTLVQSAAHNQSDREIVRAVLALASALTLQVVAEGLETAERVALFESLGCPLGQGYGLARPGAADAIDQILLTQAVQPGHAAIA
jgi:EAL domain-containing protein (putative c-di-GMP-specific phosphodiesterase class I)